MEDILHGCFVMTDVLSTDTVARAGARLLRTFGSFNPAAKSTLQKFVDEFTERLTAATSDGDLRDGLDPESTSASIVAGILGAELLSSALADGADLRSRFARNWELLLPAIITDASLGYYREFLARQAARQQPTSPPAP
jgi:hypothetical protein